jgi:hypothetical protein
MADKKKDKVKVRDLKPNKDAKGGYHGPARQQSGVRLQSGSRVQSGTRTAQ